MKIMRNNKFLKILFVFFVLNCINKDILFIFILISLLLITFDSKVLIYYYINPIEIYLFIVEKLLIYKI